MRLIEEKYIPYIKDWRVVKQINAGLSRSDKYYLKNYEGEEYLVRIADIREYDRKRRVFTQMQELEQNKVPMSKPIEIGTCGGGQYVYTLLSWVPGESLSEIITSYSKKEQYEMGIQAGRLLRTIHHIKVSQKRLAQFKSKKPFFLEKMVAYERSKYHISGDTKALALVRREIDQIEHGPIVYLHGDYKMGNTILSPQGQLVLIDFECCKLGDAYEDFFFTAYSDSKISKPFVRGKIDGYFKGEVPKAFWRSLRVYTAAKTLIFIPYNARRCGKSEDEIYNETKRILRDYDYFERLIPRWYQ